MNPIPKDIPLPLPAPEPLLVVLLVAFFLLHILFVNLMVGGSILTLVYQIKGLKDSRFDRLARVIAGTITTNKSIAVVLGIGPLLAINTIYTVYFYSANALTGGFWLAIIPLVIAAFLLTYLHKFLWDQMSGRRRLHIAVMAAAVALFLFIPLIFLTNINLMLFPGRWTELRGFFSALLLPNVLPRYAHFLLACLAATGLFLAWLFRRANSERLSFLGLERKALIRLGYQWALAPTLLQFLIGPLVLLTLPSAGVNEEVLVAILSGAVFAIFASALLAAELRGPTDTIGRRFWPIAGLLTVTVVLMASGRHLYREASLAEHKELVRQKTEAYLQDVDSAAREAKP